MIGYDLVRLDRRLGVLQVVRAVMAVGTLAAALAAPATVGAPIAALAPVTAVWAALTVGTELLRRTVRRRALGIVSLMLLVDGLWIAAVVARSGGAGSALTALAYLHVVAATLAVSFRTGLKIAVWHALLLMVGNAAVRAGYLTGWAEGAGNPSDEMVAFVAGAVIVVAAVTAVVASLNEAALRAGKVQLGSLVDLSAELGRASRPDEVDLALLGHVSGRLGFRRAAILTGVGGRWEGAVHDGVHALVDDLRGTTSVIVDEALRTGAPQAVKQLPVGGLLDRLLPFARNVVVVPLHTEGGSLGVLAAEWGQGDGVPAVTVDALVQSGAHAALSLRNAVLLEEVERLATVDPLTGLANRRSFEETLRREVERSNRTGEDLSLVVLDVDHFKQVNDTHGHPVGDEVLRAVGTALSDSARGMDAAARFGGEEFVVLLPACSSSEAQRAAERLREAACLTVGGVTVTTSAGVATYPANAADGVRLLAAADAALYSSKRNGRNRTTRSRRRGATRAVSAA